MLCTSGFVDDDIFSHNRSNEPESKTTRMLHPVRQVVASGTKSAVSDSILFALQYAVCSQRCNEQRTTAFTADVKHRQRSETSRVWVTRGASRADHRKCLSDAVPRTWPSCPLCSYILRFLVSAATPGESPSGNKPPNAGQNLKLKSVCVCM